MHPPQNVSFHEINALIVRSLSKVYIIIIPSKKEQLLNTTIKPKSSLNLGNRIVCKRLEFLFHLWKADNKKVKQSKDGIRSAGKLVKEFLHASPHRHVNASCYNAVSSHATHEALKRGFIKMNTAVPSSAAFERVYSIGKDILKPKRSELSHIHFNCLYF